MAYLNWKTKTVRIGRGTHPDYQSQLELGLSAELATELAGELAQTFAPGGSELKLELPEGWTLWWKQRPATSRMQLAHPQIDLWVATLNLHEEHGQRVADALKQLAAGGPGFAVSRLGNMAPIVNFELVISSG